MNNIKQWELKELFEDLKENFPDDCLYLDDCLAIYGYDNTGRRNARFRIQKQMQKFRRTHLFSWLVEGENLAFQEPVKEKVKS